MTRLFLLIFCILAFYACKPGIPNDIIQPEEMERILYDIHVADGYASAIPFADSAKKVISPIYKGIYQKYGIDSALQAKSMDYYYRHPNVLVKMYENITARLKNARDKEEEKEKEEAEKLQKKLADTLKPVKPDTLKLTEDSVVPAVKVQDIHAKDSVKTTGAKRKLRRVKIDLKSLE